MSPCLGGALTCKNPVPVLREGAAYVYRLTNVDGHRRLSCGLSAD